MTKIKKTKQAKSRKGKRQTANATTAVVAKTQQSTNYESNKAIMSAGLDRAVHQTCSISNPFCAAAKGSKYPDDTTLPTLAYQLHGSVPLTTTAGGKVGAMFLPGFTYQYAVDNGPTIVSGTNVYTTLLALSGGTSLLPNSYRLVSWGIRIKAISAPLNASGMVYIRLFNLANGAQAGNINSTGWNCVSAQNVPLRLCNDVVVTSRPISRTFWNYNTPISTNPDANVATWTNPGWTAIHVSVEGGPASTGVLDIEAFYNYELTFADDQTQALLVTSSPQPNPLVTKASSYLLSKVAPIFTEGVDRFEVAVTNTVRSYIAKAMNARVAPTVAALALAVD